jgi:CDP-paratose 2-epimerase
MLPGIGSAGVSEAFPLAGARTLYGATKLAAELLIAEYAASFGLRTVIDRCGVLAGPWQMGKVDQGVFTHWVLSHYFDLPLSYLGYGGRGKQVRDLLHIADLVALVEDQLLRPDHWDGVTVNVGGGPGVSLSLMETTAICRELTERKLEIASSSETRPGDVRIYISDCGRLERHTDWRPSRGPREVLEDIFAWVHDNERAVRSALG